ncbi:NAD(P)-dependent dehydrogenase (short-subunit alcohol dehydrogenase family) [Stackebrandtia endophytica]|uniref:NAD(P)-dependent dehydrogenase (Short-subunit alcohol dehydrogenase family) n=1 Tax=Stackebrandtia endophytica TaxID=1496996 RepID=A0A543AXX2_9ACTN|nr:SDR family NAD(P)-dependent oxidoreductase [Stackebrandtia endophytica]TQL77425.1 NAD(P)-dependent dehydrogenase (short-subunit alcohol dehydrogenase family) [Stackebrandtia endophytica]
MTAVNISRTGSVDGVAEAEPSGDRRRFAGRGVVVTGAAGGIGRAVVAGFRAEGAQVLGLDLADADLAVDVRDQAAVTEAIATARRRLGRLDVLVTLAGGSLGTPRDLADLSADDVDRVLDVNVKGTLYCVQAAVPHLREGGSIITCASIGGRQPSPVTGVTYAGAKAAIGGLTRRLAVSVGAAGIRVNCVAPGLFLTERVAGMFEGLTAAERASVIEAIALRRLPELSELVEPILFLASEAASYITGVTLDVNGGRYMPL